MEIYERVYELLDREFMADDDIILPEDRLVEEFGFGYNDFMELTTLLEDEFGSPLITAEVEDCKTVADLADFMEREIKEF